MSIFVPFNGRQEYQCYLLMLLAYFDNFKSGFEVCQQEFPFLCMEVWSKQEDIGI